MKIVCFGEIMLRLSPPDGLRFLQANTFDANYGGSEANVAVSLAQWGIPSSFVTRVPDNELGRAALGAVTRHGASTQNCIFGGERLGLYFLEPGVGRRGSKVLYDRQNSGMASLEPGMIDWRKALQDATWLHWSGITPALSHSAADATLEALQFAAELQLPVSCDLNYRDKLWKYGKSPAEVMPQLMEHTHLILGDALTFDLYFGMKNADETALLHNVHDRFPQLQYVAMSSREGISATHNTYRGVLFDGETVHHSRTYDLPDMLDRIGSGDAFMAGLVFSLRNGLTAHPQDAIEFAAAAAAWKHYVRGDANLATEHEVRSLMAGNMGGWVSR